MAIQSVYQQYSAAQSSQRGPFPFVEVVISATTYQIPYGITVDTAGVNVFGEVAASPTANTVLDRMKTGNTSLASIDTKTPALGQALAAASVPVVLTAAQLSTLTPPAAITGFATESTLSTLNGKVTAVNTGAVVLAAGTAAFGKLAANDGVDIGDVTINNASLPVTGTFWQATQPVSIAATVTVDTELPAAAALADNTANPTAPAVGSFDHVWDGSTWDRTPGNSTDGVLVNLGANNDVTLGAALPAGGNTIGDVTISGNALTSLQLLDDTVFADDAAFTPASSKVSAVGFLFDDVASDSVDEGDIGIGRMSARREIYTQIRDAAGNERGANVNASGQLNVTGPVTNAGTFVVQENGAALTALQLIDDVVRNPADSANKFVGIGAFDSDNTQWRELHCNSSGFLYAVINGTVTVDTHAINGVVPGTTATSLGKAEDAIHSSGDVGVMALAIRKDTPANLSGADGDYEPLQVSAGRLWASATIDAALPAGTNAIGKLASNTGVTIGAVEIAASQTLGTLTTLTGSSIADDAADSGNPHKIGGVARTTNRTAVADGDRVNVACDDIGRLLVRNGQVRDLVTHATTTITSSTSETTILSAGASGVFHDLTLVMVSNTSATDCRVDFKDATAGTTRFSIFVKAGSHVGFAPPRPVTQASAANNWTATCSASVADIRIFVQADKEV